MINPRNALSWPLFPVLPLRRKGADPRDAAALGFIGCTRPALHVVSVVFVANLCDVGGRSLANLWDDQRIRKEEYDDLERLLESWEVD